MRFSITDKIFPGEINVYFGLIAIKVAKDTMEQTYLSIAVFTCLKTIVASGYR
jgi:small basic protein